MLHPVIVLVLGWLPTTLSYKFALMPKNLAPFFDIARDGCVDRAAAITAMGDEEVVCVYIGEFTDGTGAPGRLRHMLT